MKEHAITAAFVILSAAKNLCRDAAVPAAVVCCGKTNATYPRVLDGKRACPPESCGGEPGYQKLCRFVKHFPEDAEFFPDDFDASQVVFEDPRARSKRLRGR